MGIQAQAAVLALTIRRPSLEPQIYEAKRDKLIDQLESAILESTHIIHRDEPLAALAYHRSLLLREAGRAKEAEQQLRHIALSLDDDSASRWLIEMQSAQYALMRNDIDLAIEDLTNAHASHMASIQRRATESDAHAIMMANARPQITLAEQLAQLTLAGKLPPVALRLEAV
jgi:hypothetical protein